MKRRSLLIISLLLVMAFGIMIFTGCGSSNGQNLSDYMKDQTNLRVNTDAKLNILSPDAKASVAYTEDNKAEVIVQYYAMTDEEIETIEPDKAESRCKSILKPVAQQFKEDTGNDMEIVVEIQGHTTE